jgi:protoporphyrin/coproporphyrin ferrochelatase
MYDAILLVSFGGPEKPDDVLPFLENVTRGRSIPRERLLEVAEHYSHFGGKSPINDQCRALIAALRCELDAHSMELPIYWGNRNWHPFLTDALKEMRDDGIKHAMAFVTSAYSSYSGCRQYLENIATAQTEVGEGAPKVDKLRVFYNHPAFIEASADRVSQALRHFSPAEQETLRLAVTAHSIPCSMAETSDYEKQLLETARLVAERIGLANWELVFQSRSGPPTQRWLEPDILAYLRTLSSKETKNILVAPLGFLSDHLEVLYDLDVEARSVAKELDIKLIRAQTVSTHPAFVSMIRQLIQERLDPSQPKLAVGMFGPSHDVCPVDCCPAPQRSGKRLVSAGPSVSQRS